MYMSEAELYDALKRNPSLRVRETSSRKNNTMSNHTAAKKPEEKKQLSIET